MRRRLEVRLGRVSGLSQADLVTASALRFPQVLRKLQLLLSEM